MRKLLSAIKALPGKLADAFVRQVERENNSTSYNPEANSAGKAEEEKKYDYR